MEIIAGLCENIDHGEVISSVTDSSIYKIVVNYLTVPDVQVRGLQFACYRISKYIQSQLTYLS